MSEDASEEVGKPFDLEAEQPEVRSLPLAGVPAPVPQPTREARLGLSLDGTIPAHELPLPRGWPREALFYPFRGHALLLLVLATALLGFFDVMVLTPARDGWDAVPERPVTAQRETFLVQDGIDLPAL